MNLAIRNIHETSKKHFNYSRLCEHDGYSEIPDALLRINDNMNPAQDSEIKAKMHLILHRVFTPKYSDCRMPRIHQVDLQF